MSMLEKDSLKNIMQAGGNKGGFKSKFSTTDK